MDKEQILKTEFDSKFVDLMQNRMVVSYYKYGSVKNNYGECLIKSINELEKRLKLYKETGNTELLVDVANFAMIEFMYPKHKNAHFDSENHGTKIKGITYRDIERLSNG